MSDIPANVAITPEGAFARLQAWFVKKAEVATAKTAEVLERIDLAKYYFPNPREGTNRLDLGGGYDLKLDFKYNYKVDQDDLDNVTPKEIKALKLPWEELFVYKPELNIKTYRTLTAEQKLFVDKLLTIGDATPSMDIVPRADVEGQAAHAAAATAERIEGVDDLDAAGPGDYYEDGEGQWWLMNDASEWAQVENPNGPPTAAPKRKRRTKAEIAASKA